MKPEHRSALLSLASRRGQKGFSAVLSDAIESYLRQEEGREKRRKNSRRFADRFQVSIGEKRRAQPEAVAERAVCRAAYAGTEGTLQVAHAQVHVTLMVLKDPRSGMYWLLCSESTRDEPEWLGGHT
jgi:hypothetical protein